MSNDKREAAAKHWFNGLEEEMQGEERVSFRAGYDAGHADGAAEVERLRAQLTRVGDALVYLCQYEGGADWMYTEEKDLLQHWRKPHLAALEYYNQALASGGEAGGSK